MTSGWVKSGPEIYQKKIDGKIYRASVERQSTLGYHLRIFGDGKLCFQQDGLSTEGVKTELENFKGEPSIVEGLTHVSLQDWA